MINNSRAWDTKVLSRKSSGSSDDSMNLNDIVRRLKENQWSKCGNEPEQEKTKTDLGLHFQFEKVKKLEGELATEQQRLKAINQICQCYTLYDIYGVSKNSGISVSSP